MVEAVRTIARRMVGTFLLRFDPLLEATLCVGEKQRVEAPEIRSKVVVGPVVVNSPCTELVPRSFSLLHVCTARSLKGHKGRPPSPSLVIDRVVDYENTSLTI